jgi:ribosomal protein S19
MSRSVKKGPFVDGHLIRKVRAARETGSNRVI